MTAGSTEGAAATAAPTTVVHMVRHGEVDNPNGILYGRLPGYHLSELGRKMADRVAESFTGRDVVAIVSSPLERAQETAAPIANVCQVEVRLDERLLESTNVFQGETFSVGDGLAKKLLTRPQIVRYLVNPFRPSWGEPYRQVVERMSAALDAARDLGRGHEVVCVSHQLPIWVLRLAKEDRPLWHDPRKRQCTLASVTSYTFVGDELQAIAYTEPARELLPAKAGRKFVAGA